MITEALLSQGLTGFAVGGMLAMAGVLMQVLLRTPLAEPYVLGVSGGGAVAGLGCMLLGLDGWWIAVSALLFCLMSLAIVFLVGSGDGSMSRERFLLTGVVLAAGWSTLTIFLLALEPASSVRELMFWLMGDLERLVSAWWGILALALAMAAGLVMAPALDLLVRGDEQAAVLGVEVHRVRLVCYVLAAVLTALAVTLAGPIGFVGLVVPHLVRLWAGARHRILIPVSILAGGVYMLGLDAIAGLALFRDSVPVGVLSATIGVPLFLYLLRQPRRGG